MDSPKLMNKTQEVTYFALNNELNRPVDGKIPLHKDRKAVRAFFLEHVNRAEIGRASCRERV